MKRKTYRVEVVREGKWWMIHIPQIDGLTQARRLSEVRTMAVSYISVDQDVPASTVDLQVTSLLVDGHDYAARRQQVEHLRAAVTSMEAQLTAETRALARELVADEVPLRDVGEMLGVSFQRAHQLVS